MSALPDGRFSVRPVDPFSDAELLHGWITHPGVSYRLMRGASLPDVEREYMAVAACEHRAAFVGLYEGRPAFLIERYDPARFDLAGLYEPEPGDIGMHLLVAPTADRRPYGFERAVLTTALETLFADPAVGRVVVAPDADDTAQLALDESAGFRIVECVTKPEKAAYLSHCTRETFLAARTAGGTLLPTDGRAPVLKIGPSRAPASSSARTARTARSAHPSGHGTTGER